MKWPPSNCTLTNGASVSSRRRDTRLCRPRRDASYVRRRRFRKHARWQPGASASPLPKSYRHPADNSALIAEDFIVHRRITNPAAYAAVSSAAEGAVKVRFKAYLPHLSGAGIESSDQAREADHAGDARGARNAGAAPPGLANEIHLWAAVFSEVHLIREIRRTISESIEPVPAQAKPTPS